MRFIYDYRESLTGKSADLLSDYGKFLQRGYNDSLA